MLNPIGGKLQGRRRRNHRAETMALGARFAAATRGILTVKPPPADPVPSLSWTCRPFGPFGNPLPITLNPSMEPSIMFLSHSSTRPKENIMAKTQLPAFMQEHARLGRLDAGDLEMPRLKLLQPASPELTEF